jgi:hypothetical protein
MLAVCTAVLAWGDATSAATPVAVFNFQMKSDTPDWRWLEKGLSDRIATDFASERGLSVARDRQTGKTTVRKVAINSDSYRCERSGMMRLEREDLLDGGRLAELAAIAKREPNEFRAKDAGGVGL